MESLKLVLLMAVVLGLGAYILGSIPMAYILVRLIAGRDVRQMGSGNVGALNTFHQVGIAGAMLVFLMDAGKGALAVLAPSWLGAPQWTMFMTTTLVVAGHNWPVLLNFRGGKGAATIFGISLVLAPLLTLITLGPVVVIVLAVRNLVIGVAFGFIMLNMLLMVTRQDLERVVLCVFLTLVVTVTYLLSTRNHVVQSIKGRRWKELFTDL